MSRAEYVRLPRYRRHTPGTLRTCARADTAHQRRNGLDPDIDTSALARIIPAWPGRDVMLALVRDVATTEQLQHRCRREGIAVGTWLAVITNDILDADYGTGRGMRTSQSVAAARIHRSERVIHRARRIAVEFRLCIEVYRGRELTGAERHALTETRPGHQQRGLPNEYWFSIITPGVRARVAIPHAGHAAQIIDPPTPKPRRDTFCTNPALRSDVVRVRAVRDLPSTTAEPVENSATNSLRDQHFVTLPCEAGLDLITHLKQAFRTQSANASCAQNEPPPAAQSRRPRADQAFAWRFARSRALTTLLNGVFPPRLVDLLEPYRHAGWRPDALGDAVAEQATLRGIWGPARHPRALLKALLGNIDTDHGLWTPPGPMFPAAQPCGSSECTDGWVIAVVDGTDTTTHCPTCHPNARADRDTYGRLHPRPRPDAHHDPFWEPWDGADDPPF